MGAVLTINAMLGEEACQRLLAQFPPRHPNVFCRHVTMAYRDCDLQWSLKPQLAMVIGEVVTSRFYTLALKLHGSHLRPDGRPWHITVATADGVPPAAAQEFDSNEVRPLNRGMPPILSLMFIKRPAKQPMPEHQSSGVPSHA